MWGGRWWVLVVTMGILSGCAGGRTHQDLARVQSQVGLLEERVSQLERGTLGSSSAASPSEMAAWSGTIVSGTGTTRSLSGGGTASPTASVKPSTREIQQALKNAGFYQGAIDGKMGPLTRAAVQEFQRVHGLTDDGVVGKQTWAKLRAYTDLSSASPSGEVNAAEPLK